MSILAFNKAREGKPQKKGVAILIALSLLTSIFVGASRANALDAVISISALPGVTAPVTGATPVTTITTTAEYSGSLTWLPVVATTFLPGTVYTATITLTPVAGYTLTGVTANFFTVAGTSATNPVDSGVITAVFPATALGTALTPTFGTYTPTATGFTVQISNYNALFTWAGTATASGVVAISGTGLVTVSGVAPATASVATITTTRTGYTGGSAVSASTTSKAVNSGPTGYLTQTALLSTSSLSTIQLMKSTTISTSGGSGVGAISYATSTPLICSVTAAGVVTGLAAGTCYVAATKAADATYFAATSAFLAIVVSDSDAAAIKAAEDAAAAAKAAAEAVAKAAAEAVAKAAAEAAAAKYAADRINAISYKIASKTKSIRANLSIDYANLIADFYLGTKSKSGKWSYKKFETVQLDDNGDVLVKTVRIIKAGMVIRVQVDGKTIKAVTVK
jgi:hypothetical protein